METGLIIPVALTMLVSGMGLIITANINVLASTFLLVAIILYLIALSIAIFNQVPTTSKLLKLTVWCSVPWGPPGPPSPEVMALINRARYGGMVLTGLLLIIIFLMVIKPGGIHTGGIFG